MANFVLILLCLCAGFGLRWSRKLPLSTPQVLNAFVIYLSFPALVLIQIPPLLEKTRLEPELLIPVSMAWLVFILAVLVFVPVGKWQGWSRATIGAMIMTAGLGNTSFVGFPLLEALFGPGSIPTGIVVDQAGSFLVISTAGIVCAAIFSGSKVTPGLIIKKIVFFPPFIALVIAFLLFALRADTVRYLDPVLGKLSATLVPLALVSVGFQLDAKPSILIKRLKPMTMGLVFKLVAAPALLALLYIGVFSSHSVSTKITLIESAMAPMITGAIVASEFHLDTELANLMVGVGIPLSLLTVPVWYWILAGF